MKFLIVALFLIPSLSLARHHYQSVEVDKPLYEEFHFTPKFSLGLGSTIMDNNKIYANVKLFLFNYGESYAGVRFLGLGAVIKSDGAQFSFSPFAMHAENWMLAIDIQKNESSSVGVSLNRSF